MESASRARICDLPNEMLVSIFSFLPVADLAHCAAVCDQWHEIVKGFPRLWKGKTYDSTRSPTQCAKMRAVLHILPPLQEAIIDSADGFVISIQYPWMYLTMKYITVLEDFPRLRCECLSTRVDIAGDILSRRSIIDFDRLRHLWVVPKWSFNHWAPHYSADYVVRASLSFFPSLTLLSICTDSLSADYLDTLEGLNRLKILEIACPNLQKLSFLRHCSAGLEELQLVGCAGLPSRELAELTRLKNLRRLRLSNCQFEEGDLAAAVADLGTLESLKLNFCSSISDLSVLKRCARLRKLCITNSLLLNPLLQPQLRLLALRPPSGVEARSLHAEGIRLTANSLSSALSRLEEMLLCNICLDYLGALRDCSQLRHVCCDFVRRHNVPHLFYDGVRITVSGSIQS